MMVDMARVMLAASTVGLLQRGGGIYGSAWPATHLGLVCLLSRPIGYYFGGGGCSLLRDRGAAGDACFKLCLLLSS
jgi:hypothetical protein